MLKIGITGNAGFIGKNLSIAVESYPELFERIEFNKSYFDDTELLNQFVLQCDVIIHLAALSRHPEVGYVLDNNLRITKQLISAMTAQNVKPYLIFTSSIHDKEDSEYGRSKRLEYELLSNWAHMNNSNFSCFVLSNIYGPFCKPNYASFVATFCYKLSRNESPIIDVDRVMKLTYIGNFVKFILNKIVYVCENDEIINEYSNVDWDVEIKVSEVLQILLDFKENYKNYKINAVFSDVNKENLFKTFSSYFE